MKLNLTKERSNNFDELEKSVLEDGAIYLLPPTDSSLSLVEDIIHFYRKENGFDLNERIHEVHSFDEIVKRTKKVRKNYLDQRYSESIIKRILADLKAPKEVPFLYDVLRLRSLPHNAHKNGLSPHSYSIHRDCWYANPQNQINIWIPINDVTAGNSFQFYPSYFKKPIKNTSNDFEYERFIEKAGFQTNQKRDVLLYPTVKEKPNRSGVSFTAKPGSILIFSASHLHGSCLNETEFSRFSVDFRIARKTPKYKALNIDNHSQGDATRDYCELVI